jgi:5'-phosphate synthase pdxT subunit
MKQKVGVLSIQGSFVEHANILKKNSAPFAFVRSKEDLAPITHLIIPGGESTVITKLLKDFGMWEVLEKKLSENKIKIFGTCAGAIICQKLGMDIKIDRNAYGAQQESFVDKLNSKLFPNLTGVFIRAPRILSVSQDAQILATWNKEPVLVKQKNFLAVTFHPELYNETRIHQYFLNN